VLFTVRRLLLRQSPFAYAALVLVVGILVSLLAALALHRTQERHKSSTMDQEMELAASDVQSGIRRYVDVTESLAAAMGAQSTLTNGDFRSITDPLVNQALPGAVSVNFMVEADDSQMDAVEASWRQAGALDLHLDRTRPGVDHRFVVLTRTLDNSSSGLGRDVGAVPEVVRAMDRSRANRRVTGSESFVLLRDRSLPVEQQQQSLALVVPVFGSGTSLDRGQFRGWFVISLRSHDFAVEALSRTSDRDVNVSIAQTNGTGSEVLTTLDTGQVMQRADLVRSRVIDVAGRSWTLVVAPTAGLVEGADAYGALVLGVIGFVMTLLLAALVWTLSSQRSRALVKVEIATAELEADRKLKADLLAGISELGEGVVIAEGERLVYANRAMSDMSGYTEQELLDMPSHFDVIRPSDRSVWAQRVQDLEQGIGSNEPRRLTLIRKNGDELPIEIVSKVLHADGGVQRLGVVRDISARRQVEEAMASHAEALAATNQELVELEVMRSEFFAAVSHDFRTPLTAIMGFVELTLDCDDSTSLADVRLYLDRASNAASVLHNRVESFLDYSRAMRMGADLQLTQASLQTVVAETLEQMAPVLRKNDLRVDLCDIDVSIESASFNRVVENLLTNAIKYSPEGSTIDVRIAADTTEARLYVEDRGAGIAPEHLERIFDSYFRAEDVKGSIKGSGVGLAVARQLVEAMNGRVWAENRAGGGATFCVALPRRDVSTSPTQA
jgi:PAS domain S-box-containing protein